MIIIEKAHSALIKDKKESDVDILIDLVEYSTIKPIIKKQILSEEVAIL